MEGPSTTGAPILLGLGANLGDPIAQLCEGMARLRDSVEMTAVSAVYRTEPVGYAEQPEFFNLVCAGRTLLSPEDLLAEARRIESALGRERPFRGAPRTLDVDLLAYGDLVLETGELVLPHPRLHERAFVLVPLDEIAPRWRHPVLRRTASELLEVAGALEWVEQWGRLLEECP
ncbi:MAG TPA: 2-amino-4-hydroxy-6-hydroxymethyldihydropteridine diphosphokinase [Longimicrobiaceae bacterium]|nr:2-amino-4-hydroxy-6-hydroxymethyldihydropteridine diphosphokinase [Longimicrobiaceae bacterium]